MSSSFDKLERLFSSTRRKNKAEQAKRASQKEALATHPQCHTLEAFEGSLFPSPSFIKPTSTRMQPRGPTYEKKSEQQETKGRSHSLPSVQPHLSKRLSGCRHSDVGRKTRSYASTLSPPLVLEEEPDSPSTQRSSVFRFPEDSLFRYSQILSPAADGCPSEDQPETTSPPAPNSESREQKPPSCSSKRGSLLFNPNEIPSISERVGSNQDASESMTLMPPPLFSSPDKPLPLPPKQAELPTTPSLGSISPKTQDWRFPLFPKQYSVLRSPAPPLYSPPASDSGDERYMKALAAQPTPTPTNQYHSPSIYSVQSSPDLFSLARKAHMKSCSTDLRDTLDISVDGQIPESMSEHNLVPRSRLRHAQSVATLTEITAQIEREFILQEPTITDIYALSDEDIAEARTPILPPPDFPPPPPPKDSSRPSRRRSPISELRQRPSTMDLAAGEMTPPDTPTDPQYFIPMPASHSAGELGAIMAAGIAKKYNFDLVYLVSVWPSTGGNHMDPSLTQSHESHPRLAPLGVSIYASPKSVVTGRYLAAFGLSEVSEPFQIHTKTLLKTLRADEWTEHHDLESTMTRGWTRSFNCDYAAVENGDDAGPSTNNRGIIFAAYTKPENESVFPTEPITRSQKQEQLYADVKLLVESLVEKA